MCTGKRQTHIRNAPSSRTAVTGIGLYSQTGKYGANLPKALCCTSYQKNTVHGNLAGGCASKTASPFPSGKESR